MDLDAIPFRQAKQWRPVPPRVIDLIVLHAMQTGETDRTAENLGNYFANLNDRKASTHYGVDNNSVMRYVDIETGVAFGAGGTNHNGIHIEHAGFSEQNREEWLDAYGIDMLAISAELTRALCDRYRIPRVFVGAAGLRRNERGITTHAEVVAAFGGDHWDPGPGFPIDHYMALVQMEDDMTPEQDAMLRQLHAFFMGTAPIAVEGGVADNAGVLFGWTYAQSSLQPNTVADRRLREMLRGIVREELAASRVAAGASPVNVVNGAVDEAKIVDAVKKALRQGTGA